MWRFQLLFKGRSNHQHVNINTHCVGGTCRTFYGVGLQIGFFHVSLYNRGPAMHPEPQKDLCEEGIGHTLQASVTDFKNVWV